MAHRKKTVSFLVFASLTILAAAATITPNKKYRNLKVLPQDISEKQLDSIMETYSKALKVSCDFCHVPPVNLLGIAAPNNETDFALDNDMKENARRMMQMTIGINKTYFNYDTTKRQEFMNVISCNTCHRGNPFPAHE